MLAQKGVLIVEDHPLFREGLKSTITRTGKFRVVGETGKALKALRLAAEVNPDIVLIDVSLPDWSGIDLARTLHSSISDVILMIVSVHSSTNYISASFQAGVAGYVVKDAVPETLLNALDVVSQGGYFLEGPISETTVARLKGFTESASQCFSSKYESLTRRQKEVMQLLVQGLSYKAIADELSISPRTVEGHRNEIMHNLGLSNTVELTRYAVRFGLTELSRPLSEQPSSPRLGFQP